jgi:hypothetical protein
LGCVLTLGGCDRLDESEMRAYLEQYFALGETLSYKATLDCIGGAFRLTDSHVSAALPLTRNVRQAVQVIERRGLMALDDPTLSPDQAMVDIANAARSLGLEMRRTGLDARDCMDELAASAFGYALVNPAAVLAYEMETGALILMDQSLDILVVAMGKAK